MGEFHSSSQVFCFMASSILCSLTSHFAGDRPRKFLKGNSRRITKMGKCQNKICWSYPKISVLKLQDPSGLTNLIILRCNQGIADVLLVWIELSSSLPRQGLNTFGERAVLILSLLVTLGTLAPVAPEFSHDSGSRRFLRERIVLKQ